MVCTKQLGFSYSDVMKMPTYERRFFIVTLNNIRQNHEEQENKKPKVKYTGKGKRTITRQM